MKVGDWSESREVDGTECEVEFKLRLQEGPCHLQTYMEDTTGVIRGAYYVYISRENQEAPPLFGRGASS
jgi:hypothetical protein